MFPLIEITTVPIQIQMTIHDAKWEYKNATAEMEINRSKGGLDIKSRPIRLNLDSFEARNSVSPTVFSNVRQYSAEGKQAAYEATATYAQHGKLLLDAKVGEELVTQFAAEAQAKNVKMNVGLDFIPKADVEMTTEDGDIQIQYEMDKLNFDWKIDNGEFQFTPGDIEISIAQQPDVIIKYLGGPIYVPPSADPNYEPVDVRA